MDFLNTLSLKIPVIFPVHPRTEKMMNGFDTSLDQNEAFKIVEPLRYKEFITLEKYPSLRIRPIPEGYRKRLLISMSPV